MSEIQDSLGNDIVDRAAAPLELHAGYADRVLSEWEGRSFGKARDTVLLAWAVKEAAYKALKRIFPELRFIPRQFEFDRDTGSVRALDLELPCATTINDDYIHAVCATRLGLLPGNGGVVDIDLLSDDLPGQGQPWSVAVRRLARQSIANLWGLSLDRIEISEDKALIPQVLLDGRSTRHLLSLSHDGRFIAVGHAGQ